MPEAEAAIRQSRVARNSTAILVGGAVLVLLAYGSAWLPGGAPIWGAWLMILGAATIMTTATTLGALRSGVRRRPAVAIASYLFLTIVVGFGVPTLLPAEQASSALFLGLPVRAAIEIYGVGLLPLLVLPVVFAMEFRSDGLDEQSLAALRARYHPE